MLNKSIKIETSGFKTLNRFVSEYMLGLPSLSLHMLSKWFESEEKSFFLLFWLGLGFGFGCVFCFKFDQIYLTDSAPHLNKS